MSATGRENDSAGSLSSIRSIRRALAPPEVEEGVSPIPSPAVPHSPSLQTSSHHALPPPSSIILNASWNSSTGTGNSSEIHALPTLGSAATPNVPVFLNSNDDLRSVNAQPLSNSNDASIGLSHSLVNANTCIEELHEEGDLQQPWYTCLYSPPSLQQSPLQQETLVDGGPGCERTIEGAHHSQQSLHVTTLQTPVYSLSLPPPPTPSSAVASSDSMLYCSEVPAHVLPLTLKVEENPLEDTMASPFVMTKNFNGGEALESIGIRAEDYRLEKPENVGGFASNDVIASTGTWMLGDDHASTTWNSVRIESWNNSHGCNRYVNEEGPYWFHNGWQMTSASMMDENVESPHEPISSPQDGASTSGIKRPDSKKCGVCGDRALGYNFNAITCESCKAFFRRNALKNKEFRCPFKDCCEVDQVTRRFCQKCRLRKCFEIGMKKEWIMTDEEKQRKKQKIEENRARKMGDAYSDDDGVKSNGPPFSPFSGSSPGEPNKPQAVVVGVIRSDDESSAKVLRTEGVTDIHSQERAIIQSTGAPVDKVTIPSSSSPEYYKEELDYSNEFTGSPPRSQPELIPACSEEQDFLRNVDSRQQPRVLHLLPYSHTTSLSNSSTDAEAFLPSPTNLVTNSNPGLTSCHSPVSPATPASQNFGNLSMAQVMAINIKKEVEYADSETGQSVEEPQGNTEVKSQDSWQNFSVQEALRILQPGCKTNASVTGITMMDSIMNTAISAEYSAFSLLGSSNPRELNEPEKMKLNELSEANKGLMAPLCEDYNFKDLNNPSLINIINMTEIAIRRLIKMSKRISAFKSLCQEDQIALLKGGCTEMMILRSVFAYDPDKDSWTIQQDHDRFKNIKLKVLKAAPGNVYEEHKRFILAFQPEWRRDLNIIFLLSAITLFMPERPNIIHAEAIKHEQCSYLFLLKRYLECKYGGCEGRTVYHRLLERINHLHILNENHIRVFLEVNPQEVEPLLIEIFDLKQR